MGTHIGNDGRLKIGANFVAELKEWSYTTGVAITDKTSMGADWDTHDAGTKNWKGSATCHWDTSDSNGQVLLVEGAEVELLFHPEGGDAGDFTAGGTATVEEVAVSASLNNMIMAAFTFRGKGELSRSVVGS
jgi:hypothetical protein